jgi:hypothetical protein
VFKIDKKGIGACLANGALDVVFFPLLFTQTGDPRVMTSFAVDIVYLLP